MINPKFIAAVLLVCSAGAQAQYKPTPGEQRLLNDAALRQAEQEGKVRVGMDRNAVVRILGQPNTFNVSRRNDTTTTEQMVYRVKLNCGSRNDDYTMYVYLTNDIVTSSTEHVSCSR